MIRFALRSFCRGHRVKYLLPFVTLLSSTYSADAGWKYTEWGMSPEEVEEASQGKAIKVVPDPFYKDEENSPEKVFHLISGDYEASGKAMKADFLFDSKNKLVGVNLRAKNQSDCSMIQLVIERAYGEPVNASQDDIAVTRTWWDEVNMNSVTFGRIDPELCMVAYYPLDPNFLRNDF